jgi:hypothetical protein
MRLIARFIAVVALSTAAQASTINRKAKVA